jgi:hypothetical protein
MVHYNSGCLLPLIMTVKAIDRGSKEIVSDNDHKLGLKSEGVVSTKLHVADKSRI